MGSLSDVGMHGTAEQSSKISCTAFYDPDPIALSKWNPKVGYIPYHPIPLTCNSSVVRARIKDLSHSDTLMSCTVSKPVGMKLNTPPKTT